MSRSPERRQAGKKENTSQHKVSLDELASEYELELESEAEWPGTDESSESDDEAFLADFDIVKQMLKDFSQVPLLTPEEEIALFKRIKVAELIWCNWPELSNTYAGQQFWLAMAADGAAAYYHVIEANTRLVISVAKRYLHRRMPLEDLAQEGAIGLMKAVQKFEYERGWRFSTYATWWIRQAVTRSIADAKRNIRVPVHVSDNLDKLRIFEGDFLTKEGRLPTRKEIQDFFNWGNSSYETVMKGRQVEETTSLNTVVGGPQNREDGDSELGSLIEDTSFLSPEEAIEQSTLISLVNQWLSTLSVREETIISMRYALGEFDRVYTLEEIGEAVGVTRERIRQIEAHVLNKAERSSIALILRDFLKK